MKKFGIRDLVNAGVFSLLTVMATWCGGMIGFIPLLMPLVPFACGLFQGQSLCFIQQRLTSLAWF